MTTPTFYFMRVFALFVSLFAFVTSFAQIPNSSFEVWDSTAGYKMPVGWDNLNPNTASTSVFTCAYGSPSYNGSYYLDLMSKLIPGTGPQRGLAVSGILDHVSQFPKSGFPFTQRPQVLAGYWQYMAMSTADQGYITTILTKWNSTLSKRDTIANTKFDLPDMVMVWRPFHIPLDYLSSAYPDSAIIVLSASGAALGPIEDGSYLWVDDLRFGDSATLGNVFQSPVQPAIRLFPNPANEQLYINYHSSSPQQISILLCDVTGKTIITQVANAGTGDNKIPVNCADLSKGIYFVSITDDTGVWKEKLVIN